MNLKYWVIPVMILFACNSYGLHKNRIVVYPAPAGETLNTDYQAWAGTEKLAIYTAKIGAADNIKRFYAVDDLLHSDIYYDTAGFTYFDISGQALMTVAIKKLIKTVKILPASAGIKVYIKLNKLLFRVDKPQNLTIEINGESVKSLHVFINPIEANKPNPRDSNVIFFGPGIHELSSLVVGDHKTVYLAGGAIVRSVIGKDEKYGIEPSGLRNYEPRILLAGKHIKICGRGILDASLCPTHAGNFIMINGVDISIDGIIVRNSCGWTIPVRRSQRILINNVKILGYRANTDGIDICNSKQVIVSNCFVRTNDDLIVIKTEAGEGTAENISVHHCVLSNELAHALSLGAELREDVANVLFKDCDIIHDRGREWALRIFQSDASLISKIRFENINVEDTHNLISLWIGKNASTYDKQYGRIRDIEFKNINSPGMPARIDLYGADTEHSIHNVLFKGILLHGVPLTIADIGHNTFVQNINVAN